MGLDRFTNASGLTGSNPLMLCRYNGYTFGPSAETVAYSIKQQPDPAGRTVSHAQGSLTIREYITHATLAGLEEYAANAVALLSRNAGKFDYGGRGFGNISLNRNPNALDVKWGPWPREVSCKCVGAGLTTELTWTVE